MFGKKQILIELDADLEQKIQTKFRAQAIPEYADVDFATNHDQMMDYAKSKDYLLIISKSGNTAELSPHAKNVLIYTTDQRDRVDVSDLSLNNYYVADFFTHAICKYIRE